MDIATTATPQPYDSLLSRISETYTRGRVRAVAAVNAELTKTYWEAGKHIVEFEQGRSSKAFMAKHYSIIRLQT